jgi:RHS repeat-associated protein
MTLSAASAINPAPYIPPHFTGVSDPTENHFTGKERDTESGNDYFGARYLSSTMGQFLTPDWSAKVEPIPYSKLGDLQSLNLTPIWGTIH